jgi:hypothetical protein
MQRKPRPDAPRGPVCYYLGQTNDAGLRSVLFAIGQRRYEYTLTPQQIESVEHLCKRVSILKGLNFAKRKARAGSYAGATPI